MIQNLHISFSIVHYCKTHAHPCTMHCFPDSDFVNEM